MRKILLILMALVLSLTFVPAVQSQAQQVVLPEGADFATQVLRDPWDMDAYSDVSQYINQSGQKSFLQNISVEKGIFSAESGADRDPQFFAHWPGYPTAILNGKVGAKFPIDANKYHCLYLGMKVSGFTSNWWQAFWFEDDTLNGPGGGKWGLSGGQATEVGIWKLYEMDLENVSMPAGFDAWTSSSVWRGLRIDPLRDDDQGSFEIDWIRLTDCTPVIHTIHFDSINNASIYLRPEGATREILVASDVSGDSYDLDVQGVEPGNYEVVVRVAGGVLLTEQITINQAPILHFEQPSFISGWEYSRQYGNAWDMSTPDDVDAVTCAAYGFTGGNLDLATVSIENQPPQCIGGPVSDPKIYLNVSEPIDPGQYRYLNFKMNVDGPWQNVPEAMIARLIWTFTGPTGACTYVGHDITFDVGWHEYTVDLWDSASLEGQVEATAGNCPADPTPTWLESYPIYELRLDPNENIMGSTLYQNIDWVQLNQQNYGDRVHNYRIYFRVNKDDYTSVTFFYTTDPVNNPTQYQMEIYTPTPSQPSGPLYTYLPLMVFYPNTPQFTGESFLWETENVSAGEYYVCAVIDDLYNSNTFCSPASVIIN